MTAQKRVQPPANLVLVTLDRNRGLALIRGPRAKPAIGYVGREQQQPRWSEAGKGYVTSYDGGLDVIAYSEMRGWIVRVTGGAA